MGIFHVPQFAQRLPIPQVLIPPSIDPLSAKNCELTENEITAMTDRFGVDRLTGATQIKPIADQPPSAVRSAGPVGEPEVGGPSGLEAFGLPGVKTTSSQVSVQTPVPSRGPADPADPQLPSEALLQARDDLQARRLELIEAKDQLQDTDRAIKVFDSEFKTEQLLVEIARKQADNAEQASRLFK